MILKTFLNKTHFPNFKHSILGNNTKNENNNMRNAWLYTLILLLSHIIGPCRQEWERSKMGMYSQAFL